VTQRILSGAGLVEAGLLEPHSPRVQCKKHCRSAALISRRTNLCDDGLVEAGPHPEDELLVGHSKADASEPAEHPKGDCHEAQEARVAEELLPVVLGGREDGGRDEVRDRQLRQLHRTANGGFVLPSV
jgi:hypothetical protein